MQPGDRRLRAAPAQELGQGAGGRRPEKMNHNAMLLRHRGGAVGAAAAAAAVSAHRDRPRERGRQGGGHRTRWARADGSAPASVLRTASCSYVREMGGEFAREFPKIAGRLGLETFECADPYVERLLEGFAFLAARVQLKIDAEFPRFTQHLLEIVYPHYLAPMPSMADRAAAAQPQRGCAGAGVSGAARHVAAQRAGPGRPDRLRVPHRARRDAVAARDRPGGVHRLRRRSRRARGLAATAARRALRLTPRDDRGAQVRPSSRSTT